MGGSSAKAVANEAKAEAWLVVRRDHDGNLDVVRMPESRQFGAGA
jgi:hypothetical protein